MTIPEKDWKLMRDELIEHGKREITRRVEEMKLDELVLYTQPEAAGRLNVTTRTLADMRIPRIDLTGNGTALRYTLRALLDHLKSKEERA